MKVVKHNSPTSNKYVYVGLSGIDNKGLFARSEIGCGIDIVEYDGPRMSLAEGAKLAAEGNSYIFCLDRKMCIDGSVKWNLGRYANHSCSPNCESKKIGGRIKLVTLRKIAKGEEITYDYGYSFNDYFKNPCFCGSKNCAGFILPEKHRKKIL